MAAEAGGDGGAGIGTRLRAAREKKGLTILQAAEKMHLDARIIEVLEGEDFAALGAAVYARGHLRHYAELVGEQPAQLLELYANSTRAAPVQPDLTRIAHVPLESDSGRLTGPAVVVLVTIAAIGTLWWVMTSPKEKLQPTPVQASEQSSPAGQPVGSSATAASSSAPEVGENESEAGGNSHNAQPPATRAAASQRGAARSQVAKSGSIAPASSVPERSTTQPSTPPVVTSTSSGPVVPFAANFSATSTAALPQAAVPSTSAATTAASTSTAPPATRPKSGELTLKFSSDSWAEVYDASGERLFYDVGAASTAHTVRGSAPMRVVLGNAAGVTVEFNGRPAAIPSGVAPDGSIRFLINAHGRAVPATDGG
jgi:cytoskeleton protein RodZ